MSSLAIYVYLGGRSFSNALPKSVYDWLNLKFESWIEFIEIVLPRIPSGSNGSVKYTFLGVGLE